MDERVNQGGPVSDEPFASDEDERSAAEGAEDPVMFSTAMNNTLTTIGTGHPGMGGMPAGFTMENVEYVESGDEDEDTVRDQ